MGIREKLNQNPRATTAATIAIVVIALGFIVWQLIPQQPTVQTKQYYSNDDGKTWFADDMNKIMPFDKDGKPAVKANVFRCGGTDFVGYLEKYTDDVRKKVEAARAKPNADQAEDFPTVVKKPGDAKWLSPRDRGYDKIVTVTCPSGSSDQPDPQMP